MQQPYSCTESVEKTYFQGKLILIDKCDIESTRQPIAISILQLQLSYSSISIHSHRYS